MFSIIIPLYNKELSIRNTIQSVLNQTCQDFEIVVVNDGSTDNSLNVVEQINDFRIRVINKNNGGVSSARNYGIKHSNYPWILFLDADDLIYENCLETFQRVCDKYPLAEIITTNFDVLINNEKEDFCKRSDEGYIKKPYSDFWKRNIFPRTGNTIINKQLLDNTELFDTRISKYEDLDFMIRLLENSTVVYTPIKTFYYDTSYSSLSISNNSIINEFSYYINIKHNFTYKNLLLAENVFYSMVSRIVMKDYNSFMVMFKRNFKILHVITCSYFLRIFYRFISSYIK